MTANARLSPLKARFMKLFCFQITALWEPIKGSTGTRLSAEALVTIYVKLLDLPENNVRPRQADLIMTLEIVKVNDSVLANRRKTVDKIRSLVGMNVGTILNHSQLDCI